MTGYRQVLAVPGLAPLLAVSLLARMAITAAGMALTLYVVLGLHLGYAAAGAVPAALTAGLALGGPLLGRLIDRRGLRTALLATVVLQAGFWLAVPVLRYPVLLGAAFVAGLLMVPAQAVTRQAIAALTAGPQRRPAFALESVQGELSYLVGPAAVILAAATLSPATMAWGVGGAIVVGGVAIAALDPPLRAPDEAPAGTAPPRRREWLGRGMVAVLVLAFGTALLLGGIDLAIVATLQQAGQVSWASLVVAVCGLASVTGGLCYGALSRPLPGRLLLGLLGVATVLAGLAHGWPWLCLAVVGTGLLTAPTLSTVSDAVSRLAPAGVRGEATGLQASAMSAGVALGAPVVGWAVDASVPAAGFAVAGLAGIAAALAGHLLSRRTRRPLAAASGAATPDRDPCRVGA
ncbi:MFS transporter [Actinocatenispora comari]|uniref:MFS transporter n=1 Tax=Actinocatenispora comari TaxID=2807577 RepID=UPI001A929AF0|nr:MFS transporter [Actinocatenispora comari]